MGGAFALGTVGRSRAEVGLMARDWAVLVAIYLAYDYSRGTADSLGIGVNFTIPAALDRFIFLGNDPNHWLQERFLDPHDVRWYDVAGAVVYMTHFVLPVVPLAWLRVRNRTNWLQYVRRFALTLGISVACFFVFPAAPPWMVSESGRGLAVKRITGRGWWELNLDTISQTIDRGAAVMNAVAAVPSLHAGCALLVALWFTRSAALPVRLAALLFPASMALALVYFGEHFFVDAVLGWAVVVLAWEVAGRWERRAGVPAAPGIFTRGSGPRSSGPHTA